MAISVPVLALVLSDFDVIRSGSLLTYLGIIGAAGLLFVVGLIDDFGNLSHRWKFLFQIAAAEILVASGTIIETLDFGALGTVPLGILAVPFTLLFVVGLINAMNFVDGLDGLAAGLSFISLGVCVALLSRAGELNLAKGLFVMMTCLVAFLAFNFHPAKIFLGDAGSLTIGLLVSAGVIHAFQTTGGGIAAPTFLLPVFIPLLDTGTAIVRRFIAGMSLFGADRDHIHHRIYQRTGSQTKTVLLMWSIALALGASALLLVTAESWLFALGVLTALSAISVLFWISGIYVLLNPNHIRERLHRHRNDNKRLRNSLAALVDQLEKSESLWEVNHMLVNTVSMLGCTSFIISFNAGRGESTFSWMRSDHHQRRPEDIVHDEFPIRSNGEVVGTVRAGWLKEQLDGLFEKRLLTEQLAEDIQATYRYVHPRTPG